MSTQEHQLGTYRYHDSHKSSNSHRFILGDLIFPHDVGPLGMIISRFENIKSVRWFWYKNYEGREGKWLPGWIVQPLSRAGSSVYMLIPRIPPPLCTTPDIPISPTSPHSTTCAVFRFVPYSHIGFSAPWILYSQALSGHRSATMYSRLRTTCWPHWRMCRRVLGPCKLA